VDGCLSVEYVYPFFNYVCAGVCCNWRVDTLFSDSRGFDCGLCVGYWRVFCKHFYFCVVGWAALDWFSLDSDGYR
jgi:hypothetical protein